MAIKFSQFVVKTIQSDVDYIVGYKGADNVQITPSDFLSASLGAYLPLAGGTMTGDLRLNDTIEIQLGTSGAFKLEHDGSNSEIQNQLGDLRIWNQANNKDIYFQTDDGSGGVTDYIRLDGSVQQTKFYKTTEHQDGVKALFGTGSDMEIFHNGSQAYIENYTGEMNITQHVNDGDMQFKCDNGSGSTEIYFYLDGSLADGTYNYTRWNDGGVITFGGDQDLRIWHDPSNSSSYIRNYTNDLYIENTADDKDIIFKSDDGSGGTDTYFKLWGAISSLAVYKDMLFVNDGNNGKLKFGASQDLQIYHDGSDSYVDQTGTGDLILRTSGTGDDVFVRAMDDIFIQPKNGEAGVSVLSDGAVELYYDDNKKFETTSTGIDVTGTTDTDNLTIAGAQGSSGDVLTSTGSGVAWQAGGGGGATDLNGLTDCLVDTDSLYVGTVPAGLSGNPQDNTTLGINAGTALTTGERNTFLGNDCGKACATGDNNVAIGHDASLSETGSSSVAIGLNANRGGGSGSGVIIGAGAAYNGGASNAVVKGNAAGNSSAGFNSVLIGEFAGAFGGAANNQIAIGCGQPGRNNTAANHIDLGYGSGYSNTSGTENTNIGYQASYSNTTGTARVSVGFDSGYSNTGSNVVFIGKDCGKGAGAGSQTVAIGQGVMVTASEATNSVLIGNFMAANCTAGAANTVAIGVNCLSAAGYSATGNTVLGHQAAQALESGNDNTIIGRNAGDVLTTGTFNTVVGSEALKSEDAGGRNVAIGSYALTSLNGNASGHNVSVGYESGLSLSDGQYNNFMGSYAGDSITTGDKNVAIGHEALSSANSGVTNLIGIGYQAGLSAAAGSNIHIGAESGKSNSGNGRIDIGLKTGYSNTSGSWNLNVGYFAAYTNTTGSENTVIGTEAGYNNTGTGNTFLGYQAGYNQTTGSNNTVIGHDAEPSAVTVSNEITLGDSSIATLRCQVTSITALSDKRDKENIQESNYGLDLVNKLKPVTFDWNTRDGAKVGVKDLGFIAQDLQEVDDENLKLVYDNNPEKLEASYGRLVPVLVKAIQELTAKVKELENK